MKSGFGLIVPAAFNAAVQAGTSETDPGLLADKVVHISRYTAVLLIIAYGIYVIFQMRSHQTIYDNIFRADEEEHSERHGAHTSAHLLPNGDETDIGMEKLTLTECVFALAVAITLVALIAISLVERISFIVDERGVSDAFVGLILVPLVEKFAEHLTAIDEAWNNEMNMALAHVLGATIQTSLFNAPLAVLVGWVLNKPMDLNFDLFCIIVLILAILVVGNFLRDQKSNYLEGSLCVIVYINIAAAVFWYPNPKE
jgi:Ca2+:H+ antiporter